MAKSSAACFFRQVGIGNRVALLMEEHIPMKTGMRLAMPKAGSEEMRWISIMCFFAESCSAGLESATEARNYSGPPSQGARYEGAGLGDVCERSASLETVEKRAKPSSRKIPGENYVDEITRYL